MAFTGRLVRNCEDFSGDKPFFLPDGWFLRHTGGLALAASVSFWAVIGAVLYLAI
jgi:hypothetical protein